MRFTAEATVSNINKNPKSTSFDQLHHCRTLKRLLKRAKILMRDTTRDS